MVANGFRGFAMTVLPKACGEAAHNRALQAGGPFTSGFHSPPQGHSSKIRLPPPSRSQSLKGSYLSFQ